MDNLPIEIEDKKLNFIQKIRIQIFKNQKFSMKKYKKAPEYIKNNISAYGKIINNPEFCVEENLLQIPEAKLIDCLRGYTLALNVFSVDK